jgi:predicted permease
LQRNLPHLLSDSQLTKSEFTPSPAVTNWRELQSSEHLRGATLPFSSLVGDIRHSLRQLWRAPVFSIISLTILAAGIASSAAMLTVVDQVLLRNLPYREANQLVQVREAGKKGPTMWGAPFMDIQQWRERSRTLQAIAFHTYDKPTSFLEGLNGPVQVNTPHVSSNLLTILGVRPALGRDFENPAGNDFRKVNDGSVLLSDSVWRDGFGADPNVLGRLVKLNGNSYTVIGVMPRGFQFPVNAEKPQIWLAVVLGDSDKVRTKNQAREYSIVARLKSGVGVAQAGAELKVIQSDVARLYTDPQAGENVQSVEVQSYRDSLVEGNVRRALLALLAAASVLWLIACVNVTSLMLARANTLQREIAVRAALGAGRWRIMRQLLLQGLMLSGAGCALGLGIVVAALKLFENQILAQLNVPIKLQPNGMAILALLGLTVATTALSSLWPALFASRGSIEHFLRQGVQSGGSAHQRSRSVLVIAQVAMSLALLVGCGLLLRTIFALRQISLGFRTDHVIVADMIIPAYKFDGKNMTTQLYQPLVERVQRLPEVQAAALTTAVPLGKRFPILLTFSAEDAESARIENLVVQFRAVGPGLERVLDFRMLRGRFFNDGDTAGSAPVVVVNRAFVREYFGDNRDPGYAINQELMSYGNDKLAHIIGVIDDERQSSVLDQSQPEVDVCIPQITPNTSFYRVSEGLAMNLAIRTASEPSLIIPELRRVFHSVSSELEGSSFTTMDQVVDDSYGDRRMAAHLLEFFAVLALLLCLVGLYGVLTYVVTQRTRELGVRLAMGAQRRQLIWLVMRRGALILISGSAMGLALSLSATRIISNMMYGVSPYDAMTLTAATALLVATGLLASYIPARRAANVDPIQVLRTE